jgi:hypothetical protein
MKALEMGGACIMWRNNKSIEIFGEKIQKGKDP